MNKKEWYKERILWKANQFKSFSQAKLKSEKKDNYLDKLYEEYRDLDDEVLFLFSNANEKKWTVITTDKVISYHNNNVYKVKLDNINKLVDVKKDDISNNNLKHHSHFLLVGSDKLPIWAPSPQVLFALMNILRMFPLKRDI